MQSLSRLRRHSTDFVNHLLTPRSTATWERIAVQAPARASHSLDVVAGAAYMFGGDVEGVVVDNDMHVVRLPSGGAGIDYFRVAAVAEEEVGRVGVAIDKSPSDSTPEPAPSTPEPAPSTPTPAPTRPSVPPPRAGHATAVIGSRIFLFGGRHPSSSSSSSSSSSPSSPSPPLAEAGRVWIFDTQTLTWTHVDPASSSPHPPARSGHSAAATEHPLVTNTNNQLHDDDDCGTFFIADGSPAHDVWSFDVASRCWSQLPSPPGPPRSGTALCISRSRLYRFGGGRLDFLPLGVDTFDDETEVHVCARAGSWQTTTTTTSPSSRDTSTQDAPCSRLATALHAINLGGGREYLVVAMGEGEDRLLDDVWLFQVSPQGMSTASLTDAVLQALGRKTGEGEWTSVSIAPRDLNGPLPPPRAWLASAPAGHIDGSAIVVWGGLGKDHGRLGDGWILRLGG